MEYNNQISENDKRFADEFSNYVNGKNGFTPKGRQGIG